MREEPDLSFIIWSNTRVEINVILVESGKNCIEKIRKEKNRDNKIHLILLDYRLGDMLGDAVARKISEYNGVKIILISAYDLDYALIKELEESKLIYNSLKSELSRLI